MEKKEPLILPFSRRRHQLESSDTVRRARVQQGAINNQFVVHRNAGRVQKYFIRQKSGIWKSAVLLLAMMLTLLIISLTAVYSAQVYRASYSDLIDMTLASIEQTALDTCKHLMAEAIFTSSLEASMYTPPSWVEIGLEGATDITNMMNLLHQWTSGRMFYWDLGLLDGTMFSIEAFVAGSRQVTLVYVNSSGPQVGGPFLSWETDANGINEDYPWVNGTYVSNYVLTSRDWFTTAISGNESTYMDPYFGSGVGNETYPMISAVCPVWNYVNETFSGVCACGVMLLDIQNVLKSVATKRSRYGLVDSYGYLVAVTGDDLAYEEFQGVLSAKTLYELKDPVWIAIVDDPKFETVHDGYRENYVINGTSLSYNVRVATVSITDKIKWTFYFALCEDDSVPDADNGVSEIYIAVVVLLVAWLLVFIAGFGAKSRMKAVENKSLTPKKFESYVRIYPPGLIAAMKDLEKVRRDTETKSLKSDIAEAKDLLTDLDVARMFHGDDFVAGISPKEIREKIRMQYNNGKFLPMKVQDAWLDVGMKVPNSQKRKGLHVYARTCFLELPSQDFMRYIISKVCVFNDLSNQIFKTDHLCRVVGATLSSISPELYPLVADSFDLMEVLLQKERFVRRKDKFEPMAMVLAVLIFHQAMKNRRTKLDLFDRYFCEEAFLLQRLNREMLIALRPGFTLEGSWEKLVGLVRCFIDICPAKECQWVIAMSAYQVKRFSTTEAVLPRDVSWAVALVTFISSIFSYTVGTLSLLRQSHVVIHSDLEQRQDEINNYITCFTEEFKLNLIKCLEYTHGDFVQVLITEPQETRPRVSSSVLETRPEIERLFEIPESSPTQDSSSQANTVVNMDDDSKTQETPQSPETVRKESPREEPQQKDAPVAVPKPVPMKPSDPMNVPLLKEDLSPPPPHPVMKKPPLPPSLSKQAHLPPPIPKKKAPSPQPTPKEAPPPKPTPKEEPPPKPTPKEEPPPKPTPKEEPPPKPTPKEEPPPKPTPKEESPTQAPAPAKPDVPQSPTTDPAHQSDAESSSETPDNSSTATESSSEETDTTTEAQTSSAETETETQTETSSTETETEAETETSTE